MPKRTLQCVVVSDKQDKKLAEADAGRPRRDASGG